MTYSKAEITPYEGLLLVGQASRLSKMTGKMHVPPKTLEIGYRLYEMAHLGIIVNFSTI
jgi:hypothetical protein